jgi:hypothetical protein
MLVQLLECAVLEQVRAFTAAPPSRDVHSRASVTRRSQPRLRHATFTAAPPSRDVLTRVQRFGDASHFKFLLYRCALEAGATSEQVGAVLPDFSSKADLVAGAVAPPRRLALPRVCCRF